MKKKPVFTVAERKLILDIQRLRRVAQRIRLGGTVVKIDELIQQVRYEARYFPWPHRKIVG